MGIEWIVKAVGAALLVAASVGFGVSGVRTERRRRRELDACLALLRHIRENIGTLARPLPEIWDRFEDPVFRESGFLTVLRREGLSAALEAAPPMLGEGERALLAEFAASLGRGYREEQVALCRYTEEKLGDAAEALARSAADRERLWRSLPVLAALSAVLLML